MEEFLEQNNISFIYKYHEERKDKANIEFGWRVSEVIDITKPIIISYYSRTKFASEDEIEASKSEGKNIALLSDYIKFFTALTGVTPKEFYNKWKNAGAGELKRYWNGVSPSSDDRQHLFVFKLSELILTEKKFVMYGRGYKMMNQELTNE